MSIAGAAVSGLQCKVWQPQGMCETPYSSSTELFIDFYLSLNEGDDEEMSGWVGYKNFRLQRCRSDWLSWSAISWMLSETNVPYHLQPFFIQHISIKARRIATQPHNALSPTIPIAVDLVLPGSGRSTTMPSIHHILERVVDQIDDDHDDRAHICVICLDEISVSISEFDDSYAPVRMPCFHVFHRICIRKWLQISKPCPLCRFHP